MRLSGWADIVQVLIFNEKKEMKRKIIHRVCVGCHFNAKSWSPRYIGSSYLFSWSENWISNGCSWMILRKVRLCFILFSYTQVPGFRPGKQVPESILVNYVGKKNVQKATVESILKRTLPHAMSSVSFFFFGLNVFSKLNVIFSFYC